MDEPSDGELLERCAAGEQEAARLLLERFHPLLVRIARAHHPRSLALEDVVQEVVLKMFTQLSRYQVRSGIAFSHWLSRLAVHSCLDLIRSEDRRRRREGLPASQRQSLESLVVSHAQPVEDALAARDLVERLLGSLPPRDSLLLTLLDRDGLSIDEVALTTGWNRTVIKVRAFRARRRLRRIAEELLGESPAPSRSVPARSAHGAHDVEL
jgi:RNA polymerase sigma factor (sigma-70 family)